MRKREARAARAITSIEQRLAIEHGATQALSESASLAEAAPKIIATVCRTLGWRCGSCWIYVPVEDALKYTASWGLPGNAIERFLEATQTMKQPHEPGGLLQRTWLGGEPVWTGDVASDASFRRAPVALEAGLHGAFGFPFRADDKVLGVMEFFSRTIQRPDRDLLDCMSYVGSQIGQFVQRTAAQERLRESEERFQSTIELAAIGIAHIGESGRVLHANQWLCDLLGYTRDELLRLTVRDVSHPDDKTITDDVRAQLRSGQIRSFQLEKRYLRKDSSTVWVALTVAVQRASSGEPLHDIAVIADISERKRAEEDLRRSEERFRSLTELSSDWYWEQDSEHRFTKFDGNRGASGGYAPTTAVLGKLCWEIPGAIASSANWEELRSRLTRHEPFRDFEYSYRDDRGAQYYVSVNGEPVFDEFGNFAGYRGTARDITGRKEAEERIQYLATHDGLTDLPNRLQFSQLAQHAIDGARRYKRTFAVLFIDLDRFKFINDTLGHQSGDELLRVVSARLKATLRASDVVARLGGDEFVAMLPEVTAAQVSAVARKILSAIIKPVPIAGQQCRVTASIGISMFPADATDERMLMKNADAAMYLAKEEGKNNFQFYSKDLKSKSLEKMALETHLRRALECKEFSLQYQAKQNLKSGAITGVEALLRWHNAELGQVSPAQLIPVAEETGLIVPIGKWVLRTACEQSVAWRRDGLPPICMAVNLSPRQFADPELLDEIALILRETGLPAHLLELEITEGMVMHNPDRAIKVLRAIKEMGLRLAIDDFGTGYSSLSQLKRFPIDTLKVDRSFIRDVSTDPEDKAIAEAIIAIAKKLSLTVIAEGVETAEQRAFLREHGCDEMQGYYFSKPVAAEEFAALVRKHAA
jgi:diguanylate cyclase (GGDEF)-like protein/PAS domain S-box-containing protein